MEFYLDKYILTNWFTSHKNIIRYSIWIIELFSDIKKRENGKEKLNLIICKLLYEIKI